jgi:hypothetical protein
VTQRRLNGFLTPFSDLNAHSRRVLSVRALRPVLFVLLIALAAALTIAAASSRGTGTVARAAEPTYARSLADHVTVLQPKRLQQAEIAWRGGPILTSTGETVNVLVSETFAPESVTPEGWAEFLVKLVHGPELAQLTTYIAPLAEIRLVCGSGALGCYSRNRSVSVGEALPDGTTPEEVVRHEYGHHIALYRSNDPWRAIDWGPKRWASSANVCARVARGEAFPGNEAENYQQNPGEAWAEAYRLMDERKNGITTGSWQVVAPSFYPSEAALQAAELDVAQPWAAGGQSVYRRNVGKGRTWFIPLSTPLDGSISVRITLPRGGTHDTALVASNRRRVLERAFSAGTRTRTIAGEICGQRSVFVRVTQSGKAGPVSVVVAKP